MRKIRGGVRPRKLFSRQVGHVSGLALRSHLSVARGSDTLKLAAHVF